MRQLEGLPCCVVLFSYLSSLLMTPEMWLLLETLEVQLECFSFSQCLTFFPLIIFFAFGFQ